MTMGRPVADLDDFLDQPPPRLAPAPAPVPTHAVKRSRTPWIIGAAAVLVAAAGVGFWFMTRSNTTIPAQEAAATITTNVPDGVAGFAELYVIAFLGGDPQEVAAFLPAAPALEAMTPGAHVVRHAAAVESAVAGDDYWTITVAADVLDLETAGYVATGLAYFQVGVVDDGGRLVATALPARVAAPSMRTAAPRFLESPQGDPTPEAAAVVGDFLEALLTDRRTISRYTTVASPIAPIRPAPYTAIAVTSLAAFADESIVVTVDAKAPNGAIDTLQYVVRFEHQGGELAVAELMAGPPRIDGGD